MLLETKPKPGLRGRADFIGTKVENAEFLVVAGRN